MATRIFLSLAMLSAFLNALGAPPPSALGDCGASLGPQALSAATTRWRNDAKDAVHQPPVARKGADVWVLAGLRRRLELEPQGLTGIDELRRIQHLRNLRHVLLRGGVRRCGKRVGCLPDSSRGARRTQQEVVLHLVRIDEYDLDELSWCHGQFFEIELQLRCQHAKLQRDVGSLRRRRRQLRRSRCLRCPCRQDARQARLASNTGRRRSSGARRDTSSYRPAECVSRPTG